MQSRRKSLIEAVANTAVGFVISLVLTAILFPHLTIPENIGVTGIFTVASIARGYVMRRIFERLR